MYSSQSCICPLVKITFAFEENFLINKGAETAAQ